MFNSEGLRKYLIQHGMMPSLKGFAYICYAAEFYEPFKQSKVINMEVADKFNTDIKSAERAIRYAISTSDITKVEHLRRNVDVIADLNYRFTEDENVRG